MSLKKAGKIENLTNAGKGRPPGVLNKATREVKEAAKAMVEDPAYVEALKRRLTAGKAPHMETLLYHYAYGKPKEQVELTGSDGEAVQHIIRHVYAALPPADGR